jgi:raffinose/stachyose/melibiose transport system substrate-binding protein
MNQKRVFPNVLTLVCACAILLSSCVGIPAANNTPIPATVAPAVQSTQAQTGSGATPAGIQTSGFDKLGPVTLNVVQGETGESRLNSTKCIVAAYEKKYPNVTITVDFKDLSTYLQTVKLLMTGDNPPDVAQGNQGRDIIPPLIQANAIVNFDTYNSAYGWDKKFAPAVIRPNRYSTDGTKFGEGSLWGLSPYTEFVGYFYNKDLLQKVGVTDINQITNLDEFEKVLDKAKQMGIQPIVLGDSDKLTSNHFWANMTIDYWDPQKYSDWVYGVTGSNVNNDAVLTATARFADWYKKGYINSDINGLQRSDGYARFGAGGGLFIPSGNWAASDVYNGLKDKVGFMLFPAGTTGGKKAAVGSVNLPWVVSTKSKHIDLAMNFVDFATTSNETVDCIIQNATLPAVGIPQGKTFPIPLTNEVAAAYNDLSANGVLVPWGDWPTPRMLDVLGSGVQQVMVGQVTPQTFVESLQKEWDSFYVK